MLSEDIENLAQVPWTKGHPVVINSFADRAFQMGAAEPKQLGIGWMDLCASLRYAAKIGPNSPALTMSMLKGLAKAASIIERQPVTPSNVVWLADFRRTRS